MEQAVMAYKNVVKSRRFKDAERRRERAILDEIAALANARLEERAETQRAVVLNMHEAEFSLADIIRATKLSEQEVNDIIGSYRQPTAV